MRVSFLTLGCKVNQYETQALRALFEKEGHQLVSDEEPADVCIVNSCSVTNMADRKSRQMIRKMKKNNPDCIIAVTGCYAQTGTQALEEETHERMKRNRNGNCMSIYVIFFLYFQFI